MTSSSASFRTDVLEFGPCAHGDNAHLDRWDTNAELRISGRYVTFTTSMLLDFARKLNLATLATRPYSGRVDHPEPKWSAHSIFIATEGTRVKITVGAPGHGPSSAELTKEQVRQLASAVLAAR